MMEPDRWEQIEQLYDVALERWPPIARQFTAVVVASAGDAWTFGLKPLYAIIDTWR